METLSPGERSHDWRCSRQTARGHLRCPGAGTVTPSKHKTQRYPSQRQGTAGQKDASIDARLTLRDRTSGELRHVTAQLARRESVRTRCTSARSTLRTILTLLMATGCVMYSPRKISASPPEN
jgi:hypothetical protein